MANKQVDNVEVVDNSITSFDVLQPLFKKLHHYPVFSDDRFKSQVDDINATLDATNPVDPRTGFRTSDIVRLISDDITPSEKQQILARLDEIPADQASKGLSDQDLVNMLPSRYNSTLVDTDAIIFDMRSYLSLHNSSDIPDTGSPQPESSQHEGEQADSPDTGK